MMWMRRVGHKGADLIEPGNTLASFDAALAHGVDMIELDVLPERDPRAAGRPACILAHDYEDAGEREPLTLEEGLAHLASEPFAEHRLHRRPEAARLRGARRRGARAAGLNDRALVSTTYRESLVRLRAGRPGRCASAGRCRAPAATTRARS